ARGIVNRRWCGNYKVFKLPYGNLRATFEALNLSAEGGSHVQTGHNISFASTSKASLISAKCGNDFREIDSAGGVSAEWISSLPTSALIWVWKRKWTAHEKAYDISDRELLATCSSLLHWRNLILPFVNFFELPPADKCPAVGRVAVYMDSNSAPGKLAGRLDSSRYTPTSNQAKRWLGWLSELLVFSSTDLTYHHVSGRCNSFADLLSRLLAGGRHLVPEGGGQPLVLFTPGDSTADEASPADKLAKALMSGQLLRELVLLQAADGSTQG
ncbi:hypothetical protein FOZ63_001306, partial [Perkinsus olseni]